MNRDGNILIEFAASLVVLSTMFAGIFQAGYTFLTYTTLVHAVRAGARYASLHPQANPTAVRNVVVYGQSNPAPDAQPIVNGLSTDNVEMSCTQNTATVALHNFAIDTAVTKLHLEGRPTVTFPLSSGATQ